MTLSHDDVIKWKHFPRCWPFVRGIHRSPLNSLQKGQWRGALTFSLICVWINGWVNNREAGDLRCHRAHYDVTVMKLYIHDDITWKRIVMGNKRRLKLCIICKLTISLNPLLNKQLSCQYLSRINARVTSLYYTNNYHDYTRLLVLLLRHR